MHESFQEGGVSQEAPEALLQHLHILQGPLEQEVPEELGGCCVAEEGEVKAGGIAEQHPQLVIVPCCSCCSHCITALIHKLGLSAGHSPDHNFDCVVILCVSKAMPRENSTKVMLREL